MAQKSKQVAEAAEQPQTERQEICFVIMPISEVDGYPPHHFRRVFEDIFIPAIRRAGYEPIRADQVVATNLIQLDILRKTVEAPMALCDLSSRNPNVLFELGLRQAFNMPVVLTQEEGTPQIFDIAPLRYTNYRKSRIYDQVLEDQERLYEAIVATRSESERGDSVNSIVKLLSLTQAPSLQDLQDAQHDPALQLVHAELAALRQDIRALRGASRGGLPERLGSRSGRTWLVEPAGETPSSTFTLSVDPESAEGREFLFRLAGVIPGLRWRGMPESDQAEVLVQGREGTTFIYSGLVEVISDVAGGLDQPVPKIRMVPPADRFALHA